MYLDINSFSIVQSYFELEDILIIYKDDLQERDKLIEKYYQELPKFESLIGKEYLESIKYLIEEKKYELLSKDMHYCIESDKAKIFYYFISKTLVLEKFDLINLKNLIKQEANYDINKLIDYYTITTYYKDFPNYYLTDLKNIIYQILRYDSINIFKLIYGNVCDIFYILPYLNFCIYIGPEKILHFITERNKIPNLKSDLIEYLDSEDIKTIHILRNWGYKFTYDHLKDASLSDDLELVKYFVSIGLKPDRDLINLIAIRKNFEMLQYFLEIGIKF